MNIQFNYYNYESLTDKERGNFISYILNECSYDINMSQKKLGEFYREDFLQDISYLILMIIKNKSFKFRFYKSYEQYRVSILNNQNLSFVYYFLENYYLKNIDNCKNKKNIILSKDFYKEFQEHSFNREFLAYIKKSIRYKWIKYSNGKNEFLSNTIKLTIKIINYLKCSDEMIEEIRIFADLSDEDCQFLHLYCTKTQSEIAKELHMTQQSISYRIKKIRKKLKKYAKL